MDLPDRNGTDDYSVRLLFNVKANNPLHAVQRYVDRLTTYGQKDWVYRVQDHATGVEYMVHLLTGNIYTLEEFETLMDGTDGDPDEVARRLVDGNGE